ncbi:Protein of unknown function [Gryllus bimaculatus]|nr:Protein of unknown function [Gryllus bimaculatus]
MLYSRPTPLQSSDLFNMFLVQRDQCDLIVDNLQLAKYDNTGKILSERVTADETWTNCIPGCACEGYSLLAPSVSGPSFRVRKVLPNVNCCCLC